MTSDERLTFSSGFLDRSRTRIYTPQTIRSITEDIELSAPGSIIDLGAGNGYLLEHVLRRYGDQRRPAYAVDIDGDLLPDGDDVTKVVASGDDVPLPDGSAALVTTHFVLSRVTRPIATGILREAYRLLAPNGQVMLVEPCLGMSTYHSDRDSRLALMMSLARIQKAALNDEERDIDENVGLRLNAMVKAAGFLPEVDDLHVARWFSAFPSWDPEDVGWMSARIADLEASGGADFLNSHAEAGTGFPDTDGTLVIDDEHVHLTDRGFDALQAGRVADLRARRDELSTGAGPVEMIPVVRVVARKPG
jgi:SAM-dependent methyltransferase